MIFTDGIHIVASTLKELHEWAEHMKIKRHWYEGYKKGHPHYDCPKFFKDSLDCLIRVGYVKKVRPDTLLMLSKHLMP